MKTLMNTHFTQRGNITLRKSRNSSSHPELRYQERISNFNSRWILYLQFILQSKKLFHHHFNSSISVI